jgi:hypothetical protein
MAKGTKIVRHYGLLIAILMVSGAAMGTHIPAAQADHVLPISGDGAIIGNGSVILGVDNAGQLNIGYREVPGLELPANDPANVWFVGLRDGTGTLASTEPGCLCEGWGIGTPDTGESGYANNAIGSANLDVLSFIGSDGDTTATSTVLAFGRLNVTHHYQPSPISPLLYEVIVNVTNVGDADLNSVIYRRVMDWDVYPTPFSEFVTISGTATTLKLVKSGNNGFATSDPLGFTFYDISTGGLAEDVDFEDLGPDDHGSIFDFEIGPLAMGESTSIKTFYGAAPNETAALAALGAVGAELYSLGQSNSGGLPNNDGTTFMFAFGSVGGEAILNTPPTLDPIPDMTVDELVLTTFIANASDPDVGQTLTFSLSGAPDGATIDSSTGVFSWTPIEDQGPGVYSFDVIVSDGFATDSQTVTITVNEVGGGSGGGGGGPPAPTYDLDLFEGSDVSDLVLNLGQEAKAVATTNDSTVVNVMFTWIDPSSNIDQTTTVAVVAGSAEDTFTPDEVGTWTVEADFGNGVVIVETLDINFMVIPESAVGTLALIASALAALGIFAAIKRRNDKHNSTAIGSTGMGF